MKIDYVGALRVIEWGLITSFAAKGLKKFLKVSNIEYKVKVIRKDIFNNTNWYDMPENR